MKPRIGLNCSLTDMSDLLKAKAVCHLKYIDAITGAGGVPIIIPPCPDRELIASSLEMLHGFCLIGGPDYLPEHYGGHPQPPADLMHRRRHDFDLLLAEILLNKTKQPLLGICGGHQLLNISSGGALIQDLHTEWKPPQKMATTLLHSDDERKGSPQAGNIYRHEIKILPDSRLARIVASEKLLTNSYHHQAVDPARIGKGLIATAWTSDGVIEALEGATPERFILGVQWHPERQTEEYQHQAIFEALIKSARGN